MNLKFKNIKFWGMGSEFKKYLKNVLFLKLQTTKKPFVFNFKVSGLIFRKKRKNNLKSVTTTLYGPFYGHGLNASRLQSHLKAQKAFLTKKLPKGPCTHLIKPGKVQGQVDHGVI